jgi:hypothetical protein
LFGLPTDGIFKTATECGLLRPNASKELAIDCSRSDLIDNLAPCEARGIDHRSLIGSERYSDGLQGTLPGAICKEPGLTIRSVRALFTLPPGFRILYIGHKVRSPRLPKGCCQHGLKLSLQSFSPIIPLDCINEGSADLCTLRRSGSRCLNAADTAPAGRM